MGWKKLTHDNIPKWISDIINKMPKGHAADCPEYHEIVHGDTFVYKIVLNENDVAGKTSVYRQLKSDYFETTPEEGTCPNCQKYVRRFDSDDYLTCHRCGWQHKPLNERLKNLF